MLEKIIADAEVFIVDANMRDERNRKSLKHQTKRLKNRFLKVFGGQTQAERKVKKLKLQIPAMQVGVTVRIKVRDRRS